MKYTSFLSEAEILRLGEMKAQDASNVKERRRIWDRCRKRSNRQHGDIVSASKGADQ